MLGPSIDAALGGFRADSWFLLNALSDLDRLGRDPMAARTFLENGLPRGRESQNYYGPSIDTARLVPQTALAQTLQLVAEEGLSALTTGTVARALVKTAQEQGLLLSLEDLALSAPQIGPAQSIAFRDSVVHIPAAPGGGLTELQILNIWQHLYPDDLPAYDNPDRLRMLTLAIRHAFADRYHWLGDPDVVDVPVEELLSETYAKDLAKLIRKDEVPVAFRDGTTPWSYFASRPLHLPRGGDAPSPWMPAGASTPTSGTTHISAADADGHFVSVTHTAANHFGSGIVCPRTGLLFDSAMAWFNARPGAANSIRPGARALANMGPVMLTRGGKPWAAIGASGGRRIISAVAQVVIGLVDFDMSPLTVLQQPRIDASGPVTVVHEHLADAMGALADLVPTIVPAGNDGFALDFGRANLVAMLPDGSLESAIDPNAYSR